MSETISGRKARPPAAEVTFADLGLAPEILRAVIDEGYTRPTPIQAKVIPLGASRPRDIMGGAQTGTGQDSGLHSSDSSMSAAPREQRSFARPPSRSRSDSGADRELALQVFRSVKAAYSKHTPCG